MNVGLAVAVFLAATVEAVEAATIVLAMGVARGWRSALAGTVAALLALAAIIAALGPALTAIPLNAMRLVVGAMMLAFGLQWLRKAILRARGQIALHDETAIYARERAAAGAVPRVMRGIDGYGFGTTLKGVLLEGLEVAFIAVTLGASRHAVGLAAVAAGAAVVVVTIAAVAARAPLSRVPENQLKLIVGVMLTSFGTFWGAEGAGVAWPGGDAALLGVVAFIALSTLTLMTTREVVARVPGR